MSQNNYNKNNKFQFVSLPNIYNDQFKKEQFNNNLSKSTNIVNSNRNLFYENSQIEKNNINYDKYRFDYPEIKNDQDYNKNKFTINYLNSDYNFKTDNRMIDYYDNKDVSLLHSNNNMQNQFEKCKQFRQDTANKINKLHEIISYNSQGKNSYAINNY